jgi:hypothetical protein
MTTALIRNWNSTSDLARRWPSEADLLRLDHTSMMF